MESILISIKKLLGLTVECKDFDADLIIHINSVFRILHQMGVGPKERFKIEDDIAVWTEFITDEDDLDDVKTYIYQKVKLIFDPPLNSAHINALKESINEFEWRLNAEAESK